MSTTAPRRRLTPVIHGRTVTAAKQPSATATPAVLLTVVVCLGAATVIVATPAMMSATAPTSRTPTGSPSTREPRKSSRSRPRASTGWTIAIGASDSAQTCSGQPASDSTVPATHRLRCSSIPSSDGRRA